MTITSSLSDICRYWNSAHSTGECEDCRSCWKCGKKKKRSGIKTGQGGLERCHIVPRQLGGPDTPDNLVILCARCHDDAPDVNDPDEMWEYIDKGDERSWAYLEKVIKMHQELPEGVAAFALTLSKEEMNSIIESAYAGAGFDAGGFSFATRLWVRRQVLTEVTRLFYLTK